MKRPPSDDLRLAAEWARAYEEGCLDAERLEGVALWLDRQATLSEEAEAVAGAAGAAEAGKRITELEAEVAEARATKDMHKERAEEAWAEMKRLRRKAEADIRYLRVQYDSIVEILHHKEAEWEQCRMNLRGEVEK